MKKPFHSIPGLLVLALFAFSGILQGHDPNPRVRTPVHFPDILGYKTLRCDFHIHTVFSDGQVWPDVRPEEAWREGLDVIAITDHIEYQPHKDDLPTNHNRSYEIADEQGRVLSITVVKGSEVTRDMPPGHLNAIFITDANPIDTKNWRDALREAGRQGAFIFWNHPGWTGQQTDGRARWYPEHDELLSQGLLNGVEVANSREYYPEAHRWCLEKGLTMLSNSDIHAPLNLDYLVHEGDHRPMTLVFARDNSVESVKEALLHRRTVVYAGNNLIGEEAYLRPLFERSIELAGESLSLAGTSTRYLQISNDSAVDFELVAEDQDSPVASPERIVLEGGKTSLLPLRAREKGLEGSRRIQLRYRVENLKITPDEGLPITLDFNVSFND